MKKIIYPLIALVSLFLLNILLYLYSDNYSFFFKKLKYWYWLIQNESQDITDNYSFKQNSNECTCESVKYLNCQNNNLLKNNSNYISWETNTEKNFSWSLTELFLHFDKNILSERKYDEYYQIFGITDEYPTEYKTFSNDNFELYLFSSWKFEEIYNLFDILSKDKNIINKFTLNQTNTFWKQSFFINSHVDDWNVKIVINNWKILIWLSIKKWYYNNIRPILEKF